MGVRIGSIRESDPGETRCPLVPEIIARSLAEDCP